MTTPADRFAAQIRAIQASIDRLPDPVVRDVLRGLDALRRQVLAQIAGLDPGFARLRLRDFEANLRDLMARYTAFYGDAVAPAQAAIYEAGTALAAAPAVQAGLVFHVPVLSRRQLEVAQAFQASLISGLTTAAVGAISQELQLGLLRGDDVARIAQRVAGSLTGPSTFGTLATRAEGITRTELGRIQAIATQASLEETQRFVPDMQKQWRHSGNAGPNRRLGHVEANDQVRDVTERFRVRPQPDRPYESLLYPRDPAASAASTVFCGCVALPYRAAWAPGLQEAA
jgi:hypothetical protein